MTRGMEGRRDVDACELGRWVAFGIGWLSGAAAGWAWGVLGRVEEGRRGRRLGAIPAGSATVPGTWPIERPRATSTTQDD